MKRRVAILGSGNIGSDLLVKVLRSSHLECAAFIGRSVTSSGLVRASEMGITVSTKGIEYLCKNPDCCDIVFDATSAASHHAHAPVLKQLDKFVVDLTPAGVGRMCIPAVNIKDCLSYQNVNMVTCGGQASIPIAHAIGMTQQGVDYIEVVSSIASRSAGPATRHNLDEYIHTTEMGVLQFSGARRAKAILNLNPADPCINMQTTVFAKVANPNLGALRPFLEEMVQRLRSYVPGYEVIMGPSIENGRIVVMVRVRGLGDYLPSYAGNLDIINCAAVAVAEAVALQGIESRIEMVKKRELRYAEENRDQ